MEDEVLLERLLAGDESAYRELVTRHHATLVRVARAYVGSVAAAEDVAQDTWIAVLKGVHKFEGRSSLRTWLLRILVNRARTSGQRNARQIPVDTSVESGVVDRARFDEGGAWSEPPVAFTDLVDDHVDGAALRAELHAALDDLPEAQQAVVTLRDVEGLSTAEVATLLGLTEGNTRVLLHRGRGRLRAMLEASRGGAR
jgi:RNA polymerase sigma-70 factor, ECF subfamily